MTYNVNLGVSGTVTACQLLAEEQLSVRLYYQSVSTVTHCIHLVVPPTVRGQPDIGYHEGQLSNKHTRVWTTRLILSYKQTTGWLGRTPISNNILLLRTRAANIILLKSTVSNTFGPIRGSKVNRTSVTDKTYFVYIFLFLPTWFDPIYYGPS